MWNKRKKNSNQPMIVNGYVLDKEQQKAVLQSGNVELIASAGSGKTLTIVGKVNYLIEQEHQKEEEILCISFTRKSKESLEQAINKEQTRKVEVKTFHQLALELLDREVTLAPQDLLEYITEELLKSSYSEVISFWKEKYLKVLRKEEEKEISLLISVISSFIHLFKTNYYREEDFFSLFQKVRKKESLRYLFFLIYFVYMEYEQELFANGWIDYDDLISLAIEKVKKEPLKKKYRFILIDEFQDTSYLRLALIRILFYKNHAYLFVVGDDYQSIYHFTGCNLSLFLHLKKIIPNLTILKIQTTYRFSLEMANISNKWMRKNKNQIRKRIHSTKRMSYPLVFGYCKNRAQALDTLITKLWEKGQKDILVLGRNKKDIFSYLGDNWKYEKGILTSMDGIMTCPYLTVHKAKGLEADIVLVLNVIDDPLGFPNQIRNHPILQIITNEKNLMEEEIRLFYVAITRAKKKTYLLTEKGKESIFLKKIWKESAKYIKKVNL